MSEPRPQSVFDAMTPMQTFFAGIVGGFLVVCTIGFFILLNMFLNAGGFSVVKAADTNVVAAPSGNTQPVANAQPTTGGTVKPAEVDEDTDHIRGKKNAAVTIIEYSDLECPFCSRFHETMRQVMDAHEDDIRWVYRHFPLSSIHPSAQLAAEASECAAEQNKFWEFADLVFERQELGVNEATLTQVAKDVGLSMSKYESCVSSGKYTDKVLANSRDAQATGGRGTPHSIIIGPNGETSVISGAQPYAAVEQALQPFL